MRKPKVSILMVVYNSSKYLGEAITSVLQSEFKNLELIIVDDNSSDNSWDIISEFNDDRMKKYKNEINLGEYSNRNMAISKATGEYFIFIDGDDTLLQKGLEVVVEEMDSYPNVGFGIYRPEKEGYEVPKILRPIETYERHYFHQSPINFSFVRNIFRTDIVRGDRGSLPTNLISGDDYIRLYISALHPILVLSTAFAKWRKHPGQASDRKTKSIKGIIEPYLLNQYFLSHRHCPLTIEQRKKALRAIRKKFFRHAISLMFRGKWTLAFLFLKKSPYFYQLKPALKPLIIQS